MGQGSNLTPQEQQQLQAAQGQLGNLSGIQSSVSGLQSQLQNLTGSGQLMSQGDSGLLQVPGGTNRYGIARPGYQLLQSSPGELDPRFLQTMTPEIQALSDKAMTQGDTAAAQLARQRQGLMRGAQTDQAQRTASQGVATGMRNLAMRGGASTGARERLQRDSSRQLMGGLQGIGRQDALAQLQISQQDEAMKNQLLGQTGTFAQKIQEANIGRLSQDIERQNQRNLAQYQEDMGAYAAIKSGNAQAAAACFAKGSKVLMSDGSEKEIQNINIGDHIAEGGIVHTCIQALTGEIFEYEGVRVTGRHAVLEDGKFIRVRDSEKASHIVDGQVVYCLGTTKFRIVINDVIFADYFETDEYEALTEEQSLDKLNALMG